MDQGVVRLSDAERRVRELEAAGREYFEARDEWHGGNAPAKRMLEADLTFRAALSPDSAGKSDE